MKLFAYGGKSSGQRIEMDRELIMYGRIITLMKVAGMEKEEKLQYMAIVVRALVRKM